jgi:hypothetical protein
MPAAIQDSMLQMFAEVKAHKQGVSIEQILEETTPESFYEQLIALYWDRRDAKCSFGYMAEQLGINYFSLDYILTKLGLRPTER